MKAGELIDLLMHYSDEGKLKLKSTRQSLGTMLIRLQILLSWKTHMARFSELMSRQKSFGSS